MSVGALRALRSILHGRARGREHALGVGALRGVRCMVCTDVWMATCGHNARRPGLGSKQFNDVFVYSDTFMLLGQV